MARYEATRSGPGSRENLGRAHVGEPWPGDRPDVLARLADAGPQVAGAGLGDGEGERRVEAERGDGDQNHRGEQHQDDRPADVVKLLAAQGVRLHSGRWSRPGSTRPTASGPGSAPVRDQQGSLLNSMTNAPTARASGAKVFLVRLTEGPRCRPCARFVADRGDEPPTSCPPGRRGVVSPAQQLHYPRLQAVSLLAAVSGALAPSPATPDPVATVSSPRRTSYHGHGRPTPATPDRRLCCVGRLSPWAGLGKARPTGLRRYSLLNSGIPGPCRVPRDPARARSIHGVPGRHDARPRPGSRGCRRRTAPTAPRRRPR